MSGVQIVGPGGGPSSSAPDEIGGSPASVGSGEVEHADLPVAGAGKGTARTARGAAA